MKNLMKYVIVMLTALSFSAVQAGDLSVSGSAKASYSVASSDGINADIEQGKGLGVANEFTLSASGELDNGYTWSYAQDIDNATVQDDGKLTLTMGGLGTVGVFISEGGLDVDNSGSQSVLARPSDTSFGEAMVDSWDLSGMNTLQYHTPADALPFGITAKVAYAPSSSSAAAANNSATAGGAANTGAFTAAGTAFNSTTAPLTQTAAMGTSATHYQVKAAPIDGLTVGADYVDYDGVKDAGDQQPESGSYFLTYAFGPATIGYSKTHLATAIGDLTSDRLESIEGKKYSIAFNVNDDFSVSYEKEKSTPDTMRNGTGWVEMESDGVQAAYTMGGMTIAVAMNDHTSARYTDGMDVKDTVIQVSMAF